MNGANLPQSDAKAYWFPAKTYGWGWGTPTTWQGWAVTLAYLVLLFGGIAWINPGQHVGAFLLYTALLSALLVFICWRTGERPRWRWGKNG
jgi:hypothetical protein